MRKITKPSACLIIFTAFFLQITAVGYIKIAFAKPDLIILCVIFFGLFSGEKSGLGYGLAAGLLKDLYAFDIFGLNALALGATGFLAPVLYKKFFGESMQVRTIFVFLFSVFSMVLHFAILSFIPGYINITIVEYLASSAVPSSAYTAFLSIPVYSLFIRFYNLKEDDAFI